MRAISDGSHAERSKAVGTESRDKRRESGHTHHARMPSRSSRLDDALHISATIRAEIGREVRTARQGGSISQRTAGALVGISHAQLGRIERAELRNLTLEQAARACSAVGLRLSARAVPWADHALDAGQLGVIRRFEQLLPPGTTLDREVPFPIAGDRRAWDGLFRLEHRRIAVEAETRIRDVQALDRRCSLKLRDGHADVLILVVADTTWNRGVLGDHREALRATFPLDGRQIRPLLRAGRAPEANGIVVV